MGGRGVRGKVVLKWNLDQHWLKLQGFVVTLQPCPKLNSHKNLCKPVNLDQIGFDLSDKEISAPDRRFVIDSVLGRGALSPAGYGPGTIACETQEHGRLL